MTAHGFVMQGASIFQRYAEHAAFGSFGRLANGFRNFACFSMTKADAAALIADDDESGKTEAAPPLHHFRNAIDMHELIDEIAVAILVVTLAVFTGHGLSFLQNSRPPSRAASASAFTRPW